MNNGKITETSHTTRAAEGQVICPQPEQASVKRCDVQALFGCEP